MKTLLFIIGFIISFSPFELKAQQDNYEYLFKKGYTLVSKIDFYGSLTHQHRDFFISHFLSRELKVAFSL